MYKANNPKDEKIIDHLNHLANEVLSARRILYDNLPYTNVPIKLTLYVGHREFYAIMAIDRGDSTAPVQTMEGDFIWFDCPIVRVLKESYFNVAPQYTQWRV